MFLLALNCASCVEQMVELGFVAVASLVQTWDGAEPDEDDGKALANWKTGCATVANTFSELLQLAWLMPAEVCKSFCEMLQHFVRKLLFVGR
jgi:hypothetical protein